MRASVIKNLICALVLLANAAYAKNVLYICDSIGNLGTIDIDTKAVSIIGNMGYVMTDIAFDPEGNLYAINSGDLFSIDKLSAKPTKIGALGITNANAMAFASDGTLYVAESTSQNLHKIDLQTGLAKNIGQNGLGAFSGGGLAFRGKNLYLSTSDDELIKIDLNNTAASLPVGQLHFHQVYALATGFDGVLYGATTDNKIISINTKSGIGAIVLDYSGHGLSGAFGAASFRLNSEAPREPQDLTATIIDGNNIVLYWQDNADNESGFELQRKGQYLYWQTIAITSANDSLFRNNMFVDSLDQVAGENYSYRIRAFRRKATKIIRSAYSSDASAEAIEASDGFDFPLGDIEGDGAYPRHDKKPYRICDTLKFSHNWWVAYDFLDPKYPTSTGAWEHTGEDWNSACGNDTDLDQPVYSIGEGRVLYSGYVPNSWGNIVIIAHRTSYGDIVYSQYAHLDNWPWHPVSPGDFVRRGQYIGRIGKGAKNKYAAHLHFEIRKVPLPSGYLSKDKDKIAEQYYNPTNRAKDVFGSYGNGFIEENRPAQPEAQWISQLKYNSIIAGLGLAGVKIGDEYNRVFDVLGPYSWFEPVRSSHGDLLYYAIGYDYKGLFLGVYLWPDTMSVLGFRVFDYNFNVAGKVPYDNGISIGSRKQELVNAFGQPETSFKHLTCELRNRKAVTYSYTGIQFWICNENDKVSLIDIIGD